MTNAAPFAADGHVLCGFAGRSRDPILVDAVTRKTVTIHDYLMERGVVYSVRLAVADGGTAVVIDDVAPDRVDSVCWFARKHLSACGLSVIDA